MDDALSIKKRRRRGKERRRKRTGFIDDAPSGTEGDRFLNFILATARDEHARAFSETKLKCDESDTTADTCDEDSLTLGDAGVDNGGSARKATASQCQYNADRRRARFKC